MDDDCMSSRKHFSASWAKVLWDAKARKKHGPCRGRHTGDPALSFAVETES